MNDAVIIGGGPAGAATAILLARSGLRVALAERALGPSDKVCGEFLSREAAHYLRGLGVDLAAHGAVPIERLRLSFGEHTISSKLPFVAESLSRRALDEALLALAADAGAEVRRGAKVVGVVRASDRWIARVAGGDPIEARAAFLATGKHDVRGHRRRGGFQRDLLAFKIHFRPSPEARAALEGHIDLGLFEGGYAGISPIEGGLANLCLVVRRCRFEAIGRRWGSLLEALRGESPLVAARLAGADVSGARPLALSEIPYGHLRRRSHGLFVLGDQAAVIPSFTGDGLSIALHSAYLAASIHLAGGDADAFQTRLARDVAAPVALATCLSQALVRRTGQAALTLAARALPALLARVASLTRVPERALVRPPS